MLRHIRYFVLMFGTMPLMCTATAVGTNDMAPEHSVTAPPPVFGACHCVARPTGEAGTLFHGQQSDWLSLNPIATPIAGGKRFSQVNRAKARGETSASPALMTAPEGRVVPDIWQVSGSGDNAAFISQPSTASVRDTVNVSKSAPVRRVYLDQTIHVSGWRRGMLTVPESPLGTYEVDPLPELPVPATGL